MEQMNIVLCNCYFSFLLIFCIRLDENKSFTGDVTLGSCNLNSKAK